MANLPEEQFIERLASEIDLADDQRAPVDLKARVYSALMQQQARTGRLASLTECEDRGGELCVFEKLVEIAPVGVSVKSLNFCRVCHARVLAEHLENPPIYWNGCPYVYLKKS